MADLIHSDIPTVPRETMQPNGDRVLLRMEEEKQRGRIIIPAGSKLNNVWFGSVLAKGKGPNADYIPLGARVIVEKMFKVKGSSEGYGINRIDCSETDTEEGGGCMLLDADKVLGIVE
jgi:co-chaperonin GroES (HSP10)